MLEEASGRWWNYKAADALRSHVEGRVWTDLDAPFVEAHASALISAGTATYVALLPAYLVYLLEHDAYNEVPFFVAGELTRTDDPVDERIFAARLAALGAEQRSIVRKVIELLTMRAPMERAMRAALATWRNLPNSEQ